MSPVKCRCQTAASSLTTKWDTASVQAQCCAMYGMRNLPPLLTPTPSPSTRPFARHISIHIYLSCSPQSSCCSAFGHSCIFGLPLSEHILAQTGAFRAATRIQYHACPLLSRVVVDVHFVTPSLSLGFLSWVPSVHGRLGPPRHCCLQLHPHPSHKPGVSPRLLLPRLHTAVYLRCARLPRSGRDFSLHHPPTSPCT